MLTSTWNYIKNEVGQRFWNIVLSGDTAAAVLVGIFAFKKADQYLSPTLSAGSFLGALMAYVAISLGFSIAGLTLVICNPSSEISTYLAQRNKAANPPGTKHPRTSFGDLVFVFSWTAVVHWIFLVGGMIAYLIVDPNPPLKQTLGGEAARWWFSAAIGLATYCVCHFFVAILTLSEFAQVYIGFLRNPPGSAAGAAQKSGLATSNSNTSLGNSSQNLQGP